MESRSIRCVVVALCCAAVGCGGGGDGGDGSTPPETGWGVAELIGGGTDADQYGMVPQLVVNAAGSALVAWQSSSVPAASASDIWTNRYDPNTGWVGAEDVGRGDAPALGVDASGGALLVWAARAETPASLQWRRFGPASGWSPVAQVPGTSGAAVSFALAMTPSGSAVLVWLATRTVWASSYSTPTGWRSPVRIAGSLGDSNLSQPQVILDGNGNGAALWIDWQAIAPFGSSALRGAQLVAGQGWQSAQTLGGGNDVSATRLVSAATGDAAVVWTWTSQVQSPPRLSRLSLADGWLDAKPIDSLGPGIVLMQLAMDPSGAAVLVARHPTLSSTLVALRADSSSSWSAPSTTTLPAGQSADSLDVTARSGGSSVVIWSQHGSDSRATVWAAELSSNLQWSAATALHGGLPAAAQCGADAGVGGAYAPTAGFDASGRALAVWAELDCPRRGVWANRLMSR